MRVLEIGCGPGMAARVVAALGDDGFVLATDRSARASPRPERTWPPTSPPGAWTYEEAKENLSPE